MHLRLQTFMFFLMFLSRLINQKSIEMKRNRDRRRFLRMKIRQRAKRLRLCKFRKMMQKQLCMCLITHFSTRTVNRHIWVKHRGTDLYRDSINWTPRGKDWYKNLRISQQTFNHVHVISWRRLFKNKQQN